ncbi:MAG: type II secretion system F family protein [Planctomycetota bacterium]
MLDTPHLGLRIFACLLMMAGVYLLIRYGIGPGKRWVNRQAVSYDRVLRRQLLLDIDPIHAVWFNIGSVIIVFLATTFLTGTLIVGMLFAGVTVFIPHFTIKHLEVKRREKLERQLVDGLTTLASGTRAGLNLVQSMQLIVDNYKGPMQQEFRQILSEYEMGLDLNLALRAASNRIGSMLYRLTFTAIEMHRVRGGDSSESMDRLAESIRDIQRLEGKLDAITSQGRLQALFMAAMPVVIIFMMFFLLPDHTRLLFTDPRGRIMLMVCVLMIAGGYFWIRKIMQVDI